MCKYKWKMEKDGTCSIFKDDEKIGIIFGENSDREARSIVFSVNKVTQEYLEEIETSLKTS